MADIVQTLRKHAQAPWAVQYEHDDWISDAADQITAMRSALEQITKMNRTGYGRTALARVAKNALNDSLSSTDTGSVT